VTQQATVLEFSYPTATAARRVERAIGVEVDQLDDDRSSATVRRDDSELRVEITASDLVALRAGINSWCRYVDTAEAVADGAVGRQGHSG
jgi:KEOPS complex subunit Pcc1